MFKLKIAIINLLTGKFMISVHVIGNFVIPTDPQYEIDTNNIKIIKYCQLFIEIGYTVHFYGANGCQLYVDHTYYHPVISLSEYDEVKVATNNFTDPEYFMAISMKYDIIKNKLKNIFVSNTRNLLEQNYKTGDFVLHFSQSYPYQDMINIKMSHYEKWDMYEYVSFETLAYMHYEKSKIPNNCLKVSEVISPWFDSNDYIFDPYNKYVTPTYLFMGKCHMHKGIHSFIEISKHYLQYNFIIAGSTINYDHNTGLMNIGRIRGNEDNYIDLSILPNVKYVGLVDRITKRELLSRSTALIQPTYYFEPCGWNVIEAMISGTPVLVPHFGGFIDTVIEGVTGYLNKPTEWIPNIEKVRSLRPIDCLVHVVNNFSRDKTVKSLKNFFKNVKVMSNKSLYNTIL
jgi:glycosyltransferase involved in cell wall biosynthesis